MHELLIWTVERGRGTVRIFGAGGPLAEPWTSPEAEAMVAASDVFWNEIPRMGAETQALAIKYGLDPAAPLATWLTADELARVATVAGPLGANMDVIARLRPWLAAQLLSTAADAAAGLHREHTADERLTATAEQAGVPVHSEFGTPDAVFESFSSWPREVEVDRLLSTVADIEAGADTMRRQSEAWLAADLDAGEAMSSKLARDYPALYDHLAVRRNQAWIPRIAEMLDAGSTAFVLVGWGHLLGPEAIPVLLDRAGLNARRL